MIFCKFQFHFHFHSHSYQPAMQSKHSSFLREDYCNSKDKTRRNETLKIISFGIPCNNSSLCYHEVNAEEDVCLV